jgi:hypothetical protein
MAHSSSGRRGFDNEDPQERVYATRMAHSLSGRHGFGRVEQPISRMMAHESSGRHGFSGRELSGAKSTRPSRETGHVGICCDHCSTEDFTCVRYKCSTCPDFDICGDCINTVESEGMHPHTFMRIATPLNRRRDLPSFLQNRSNWVHDVPCVECDASRIIGFRYFCTVCGDSVCENCEQCEKHDLTHPLLKMRPK